MLCLVQGTLILSASAEPAHFPMTDTEQFTSILNPESYWELWNWAF